jgi:hypothetical protein
MLPSLLLAVVQDQKPLGARLLRRGADVIEGAEGPDPCILLPKGLAKAQRNLRLCGLHVVGERQGIPGLGGSREY